MKYKSLRIKLVKKYVDSFVAIILNKSRICRLYLTSSRINIVPHFPINKNLTIQVNCH